VDSSKDKFDQVVSDLLQKIGEKHLIALYPVSYSHVDPVSQKLVEDYGVMVYFRG
jgi:hypothetical protein